MHSLDTYQLVIIALGAIAFGIYLLVKGGDATIDAAVALAETSGLSKVFVAATIVAFGTSAPELFTSINANLSGYSGISVGNVMGSNVANILMVFGVSAVVAPIVITRSKITLDVIIMLCATAALIPAVLYGLLPRLAGAVMFTGIVSYIIYQYSTSSFDVALDLEKDHIDAEDKNPYLMVVAGILTLLVGSEILVQGAVAGGVALGVPDAVIGMTMIAFGTSLPELTACIAAARKAESDMIVGGVIGSNIFNILSVMALSAVVKPLIIDSRFLPFDLPVVLGVTLVFAVMLFSLNQINRLLGVTLAMSYLGFILLQYINTAL